MRLRISYFYAITTVEQGAKLIIIKYTLALAQIFLLPVTTEIQSMIVRKPYSVYIKLRNTNPSRFYSSDNIRLMRESLEYLGDAFWDHALSGHS